ncbi:hypothetical protein B4O97_03630 [Marispirochaeta aestuarii]|uniref:Antirepressor protein C-terminal domain-containing protein n=1 Tax=Marispirochaeta aestuarii TaxID=1963862 RepID=A0A1Y1S1I1_9SPIO|nr:phage antirepressor KilAC domain-containing protein [Marispirochaeta aestuarii]ORC37293.1 hypothetical protein B4O97_03630 [Marispirochaeta aestuarii]
MKDVASRGSMTVKEVAMVLGVAPETVRANAKYMFPDIFNVGKTTYLNETQVTAVKKRIEGHHNLKSTLEVLPKTALEKRLIVRQAINLLNEEIEELQAQLDRAKPKIEFFDQVTDSTDAVDMATAAKVLHLGVGRNTLFNFLRDNNVLQQNNQPYQSFIDRGYFRTIEQKYTKNDGSTSINIKTVVYQKGLDFIRRLWKERYIA